MRLTILSVLVLSGSTLAQPITLPPPTRPSVQTYRAQGIEFSVVNVANNQPYIVPNWNGQGQDVPIGAVTAPFSIARTEVTVSLWQDFVNAYGPLWTGSRTDQRLTGFWIGYSESEQRWEGGGRQTTATNGAWMMGLRLCNWLHNGRVNEPWAFQSGAYDLSDIPVGQISNIVAGRVPMPGATFRLPSRDEWVAAMFYDPDRYGTNQPGYWQYPTSSDTAPVGGWPEDGGQSDVTLGYAMLRPTPVAMYENTQSPWGLFDGVGGEREATGTFGPTIDDDPINQYVVSAGVGRGNDLYELFARIDWTPLRPALEGTSTIGFRLIHVPSPAISVVLLLLICSKQRRRP